MIDIHWSTAGRREPDLHIAWCREGRRRGRVFFSATDDKWVAEAFDPDTGKWPWTQRCTTSTNAFAALEDYWRQR